MNASIGEVVDHVTRIYCPECGYYEMGLGEGNPASRNAIAITCKRCKTGPYKAATGRSIHEFCGRKVSLKAVGDHAISLLVFAPSISSGDPWYRLLWSGMLSVNMDSNYQPAMRIGLLCRSIIRAAIEEGLMDYKVDVNADSILAIMKGQAHVMLDDFGEEYCKLVMIAGDDELCLERLSIREI